MTDRGTHARQKRFVDGFAVVTNNADNATH
jgi:hypothetical protein